MKSSAWGAGLTAGAACVCAWIGLRAAGATAGRLGPPEVAKSGPLGGPRAAEGLPATAPLPFLSLRFAGGGQEHRVQGSVVLGGAARWARVDPVGLGASSFKVNGLRVELSLSTVKDAVVGVDLRTDSRDAWATWELFWDDLPWPADLVFSGPFGLAAPSLRTGVPSDSERRRAYSTSLPEIDARWDRGLFVTYQGLEHRRP